MPERSKLLKLRVENIGCIGAEGIDVNLDNIVCLVGSNNSGKSTVLRAYELAIGKEKFTADDFCKRNNNKTAAVELLVHIPLGTPNIPEKWKIKQDDLLIVKTRWEWSDKNLLPIRKTWDPEINNYSDSAKASGLDSVFYSRLPRPFRIGTLQNPNDEQDRMKRLVLQPIAEKLDIMTKDENSELSKTISKIQEVIQKPLEEHKKGIEDIKEEISKHHQQIFPDLSIDFGIEMSEPNIKPSDLLYKGSSIRFKEGETSIDWQQQGTGSQRALFWSLMQVRSRLQTIIETKEAEEKDKKEIEKALESEKKRLIGLKQSVAIEKAKSNISELEFKLKRLNAKRESNESEISLPGHMLLIDEPEVGLHPNAIRAASKYLYELSNDLSWQVMITTHSPLFVNPTEDHTTIVRLDRTSKSPVPKMYITDKADFDEEDKTKLKMLNRYDQSLAEMFFGQYPVIIEGDTEFTAFDLIMNNYKDKYSFAKRPLLFKARGKWTIPLVIKMLRHFRISFSVLHDSDTPFIANGNKNPVWKANFDIFDEVCKCRAEGINVNHKISFPNFEGQHLVVKFDEYKKAIEIPEKEKPWNILNVIKNDEEVKKSIERSFEDLIQIVKEDDMTLDEYKIFISENIQNWGKKYSSDSLMPYIGKTKKTK